MNEVPQTQALGVLETLEQLVKILGFHNLSSFVIASVFVICALAFIAACAVSLVKKRRERLEELNKIVAELQKPAPPEPVAEKLTTPPVVVKNIEPIRPKEKAVDAPKKTTSQPPPVHVVQPPVEQKPQEKPQPIKPPSSKPEPVAKKQIIPVPPPVMEEVKPQADVELEKKQNLGAALKNTRGGFIAKLTRLFSRDVEIADGDFEELEAILFTADIGVKTAQKLLDVLREKVKAEKNADRRFMQQVLKDEMQKILESAPAHAASDASPQVVMFVGVNGAGKTTSIGKMAAQLKAQGKSVLLGAGDTFRAAATLQLSVWGERVAAEVISGKENADSASVLFEAIEKGKVQQMDYVLCDTAGRLHTKTSLMDELKKVHRVVGKALSGAPHEVFLVIDATMGQNAISQAREFAAATPLTGVILSKLDGTAKGGVAIGIVDELKVPIRYIGIGEQVADLRPFDAKLFVDALFEEG